METYKQGQIDLYNRIYSILNQPDVKQLNKENNSLFKVVGLIRELNRIRDELSLD